MSYSHRRDGRLDVSIQINHKLFSRSLNPYHLCLQPSPLLHIAQIVHLSFVIQTKNCRKLPVYDTNTAMNLLDIDVVGVG